MQTDERSDKLYRLIKSLDAKQKGVVFQILKLTKNEKPDEDHRLVRLFKAVSEQKEYDSDGIFESLKSDYKDKDNYWAVRNQLSNDVLDIAGTFFLSDMFDPKVLKYIVRSFFLLEKQLIGDACDHLAQAQEEANKLHASAYALPLLHLRVIFANRLGDAERIEREADGYLADYKAHLENFADHFPINVQELKAIKYRRQGGVVATPKSVEFFRDMSNNDFLFNSEKQKRWPDIKISWFNARMDYEEHTASLTKGYDSVAWGAMHRRYEEFFASLDSNELKQLKENQIAYNRFLTKYIDRSFNYSHNAGEKALALLLKEKFNPEALDIMRRAVCYHSLLRLSLAKGDMELFYKTVKDYHRSFIKNENFIDELQEKKIYFFLGAGYLIKSELAESKDYLNRCLKVHEATPDTMTEFTRLARLLMTFILYEKGRGRKAFHDEEQKVRALLKQIGDVTPLENALLMFFRESSKVTAPEKHTALIKNLIDDLAVFRGDIERINAQFAFHIGAWFESKLQKRPYTDLIREMNES